MDSSTQIIPPKVKGLPFFGNVFQFAGGNRMEWLQSLVDQHGDVVHFKLLQRDIYLINRPDFVRDILTKQSAFFTKNTVAFQVIKGVFGESTFTADGEVWKRKRRLAQPSFHKAKISNLATIITDTIEEMLDQWEVACDQNQTIEVTDSMMRLTLDVVVRCMFSAALSEGEIQTVANVFTPLLGATNKRILFPIRFLYKLPTSSNAAYQQQVDQLNEIIYRIINERRNQTETYQDLLQMLMDARDEESGEPLDNEELRNEVMTVFIAGHETTANAMSWLWAILSKYPTYRIQIEQEVEAVLGTRKPVAADFPKLVVCQQVFKEILRLYPPVPIFPRYVTQDFMLGDYLLKEGANVYLSPYLLHRLPEFWEQPEAFIPERFEKERIRGQHPFAYLPFGGGPRICMGNMFAMMEAVFIIAMTVQRFRLHMHTETPLEKDVGLTTRPKFGVPVTLERRR